MDDASEVLSEAESLGFDAVGLAPLRPPVDAERFDAWLAAGLHADMDWLVRNRDRIVDPRDIRPDARTILVVGLSHARAAVELQGGGKVARYAAGRDYHNVLTKRLRKLGRRLVERGLAGPARSIVDAGPLLERSHAAEAGLGFASKAANLLHPKVGPWLFLGELLLDVELAPTPALAAGSCGTCTACLDACPTGALPEPGVVDANLCLSYHTIENRGAIPHALRDALGDWVFGCDVCSEVCPWGSHADDRARVWGTSEAVERGSLVDWLARSDAELDADLVGSPLRRTRVEGLRRNAALVLGNRPSDAGRAALEHALESSASAETRAAAFWSLAHGHGRDAGVARALDRALASEEDDAARDDMRASLDDAGAS